MNNAFRRFSNWTARITGSSWAFIVAVLVIIVWALTGPLFHFSDTWQLVINTGTTIVTFLMVFLIQNTQNRDAAAMHLKLDELLRALNEPRTELVKVEEQPDAKIEELKQEFEELRREQDELEAEREGLEDRHEDLAQDQARLAAEQAELRQERPSTTTR